MTVKVAVVTGADRGIGLEIVKGLCQKFEGDVYLTAADVSEGLTAVQGLKAIGLNPLFHQLDIADPESIKCLRDFLKDKYGGLDILINNASIEFPSCSTLSSIEQAEKTIFFNYFSLVSAGDILFPILKPDARVVNMSSSLGHLSRISSAKLRNRLGECSLTIEQLSELVREYIQSVRNGTNEEEGWGKSAYVVSKIAVSALTFIQNSEYFSKNVSINCVHPGYIHTDLKDGRGLSPEAACAVAPLYLALEAPELMKGLYIWRNKTIVDWYGTIPDEY